MQTLHVEWNRVELPLEESSRATVKEAHHWSEIDEALARRERKHPGGRPLHASSKPTIISRVLRAGICHPVEHFS